MSLDEDVIEPSASSDVPTIPIGLAENDSEFYQRRALEEARSAQRATCARAASSHLYLAAVYSQKVRYEMEADLAFSRLLSRLA